MPLWIVILLLGASGCGFLFLKAREIDKAKPYKKVKQGSRSVKKAAREVASRSSPVEEYKTPTSTEEVSMSRDISSAVAKDLAEIMEKKGL